jgi:hypothetical protein
VTRRLTHAQLDQLTHAASLLPVTVRNLFLLEARRRLDNIPRPLIPEDIASTIVTTISDVTTAETTPIFCVDAKTTGDL